MAPLSAQNQTQSPNGLRNTKFVEASENGSVLSFRTTTSVEDYAEVIIGEILGIEIEFSPKIDVSKLTAVIHLIVNNVPVSISCEDPNLGNYILFPINSGDTRKIYLGLVIPTNFPKRNCLLKIEFKDGSNNNIISLTCALKVK